MGIAFHLTLLADRYFRRETFPVRSPDAIFHALILRLTSSHRLNVRQRVDSIVRREILTQFVLVERLDFGRFAFERLRIHLDHILWSNQDDERQVLVTGRTYSKLLIVLFQTTNRVDDHRQAIVQRLQFLLLMLTRDVQQGRRGQQ